MPIGQKNGCFWQEFSPLTVNKLLQNKQKSAKSSKAGSAIGGVLPANRRKIVPQRAREGAGLGTLIGTFWSG